MWPKVSWTIFVLIFDPLVVFEGCEHLSLYRVVLCGKLSEWPDSEKEHQLSPCAAYFNSRKLGLTSPKLELFKRDSISCQWVGEWVSGSEIYRVCYESVLIHYPFDHWIRPNNNLIFNSEAIHENTIQKMIQVKIICITKNGPENQVFYKHRTLYLTGRA